MSEIARAYVQIEPTFTGVKSAIEQEMGSAGESGGKSFGGGFAKVLGSAGGVVAGAGKATTTRKSLRNLKRPKSLTPGINQSM